MTMTPQRQREIAHGVLNVLGEKYEAMLAGSMALREHGLTPRQPRSIDVFSEAGGPQFAEAAATDLYEAFTTAGFEVGVGSAHNGGHAVVLNITDPHDRNSVYVRLAYAIGLGEPVHLDGLGPVLSAESCAERAVGDLLHRRLAKDYVDVAHMVAQARGAMPGLFPLLWGDTSLIDDPVRYRAVLRDIGEVPDETIRMTAGVEGYDVGVMRAALFSLSDIVRTGAPDEFSANRERILGSATLSAEEAAVAFDRMAAAGPVTLGTDAYVMSALETRRAEYEAANRTAARAEQEARDAAARAADGPYITEQEAEGYHERFPQVSREAFVTNVPQFAREHAADKAENAAGLRGEATMKLEDYRQVATEASRRRALTDDERAAEILIRRAVLDLDLPGTEVTRDQVIDRAASSALTTSRTTTYGSSALDHQPPAPGAPTEQQFPGPEDPPPGLSL